MNRWQCRRYRARLVDYVDGRLDAGATAKVDAHLAACATCADAIAALRRLPAELKEATLADPGEEFWLQQRRSISRAIGNLPEPRRDLAAWLGRHLGRPRLAWPVPLAAMASLLLAFSVYRFGLANKPAFLPASSPSLSSLDDESLDELRDVVAVVAPHDEPIANGQQDEDLLTSLPLSDLIGSSGDGGAVASDADSPAGDADSGGDDLS